MLCVDRSYFDSSSFSIVDKLNLWNGGVLLAINSSSLVLLLLLDRYHHYIIADFCINEWSSLKISRPCACCCQQRGGMGQQMEAEIVCATVSRKNDGNGFIIVMVCNVAAAGLPH